MTSINYEDELGNIIYTKPDCAKEDIVMIFTDKLGYEEGRYEVEGHLSRLSYEIFGGYRLLGENKILFSVYYPAILFECEWDDYFTENLYYVNSYEVIDKDELKIYFDNMKQEQVMVFKKH